MRGFCKISSSGDFLSCLLKITLKNSNGEIFCDKHKNLSKRQTQLHFNKNGNVMTICFYGDKTNVRLKYLRRTTYG